MAKHNTILVLLSSLLIVSSFSLTSASGHKHTTTTNLRLYLHDQFNRTGYGYGDVFAFADPLTVSPDPTSAAWGHARGTIAFSNADNLQDIHVSIAYVFTDAKYNGSTVVTVGDNDVSQSTRQFPIVGGTGAFRLARGIVTGSTYSEVPPVYIYDLEIILEKSHSEMHDISSSDV